MREDVRYTVFEVSPRLRERGWQVPAYTLPAKLEDIAVLRIVVRNGFSPDMADILLEDLARVVADVSRLPALLPVSRWTVLPPLSPPAPARRGTAGSSPAATRPGR